MATDVQESTGLVEYEGVEMTLEEATAKEKSKLEELLCDRTEAVREAQQSFNEANEEAKERKKELETRENLLYQVNRDLTHVLRGEWEPPKPDPQREFDFNEEESAAVWKSKPIAELGLSKNINRILENEGFTTIGEVVREIDEGMKFDNTELTENQVKSITKAVAEFRAQLDGISTEEG